MEGEKEPQEAAKYCATQLTEPYLPDGHLYTTLSVIDIAGYDDTRQLIISYYSQYPDIDLDYEAVSVSLKYLLLPWKWEWRNNLTGVLHSLHGGTRSAIDKRRRKIQDVLSNTLKDPQLDWLSGLIIHAYADSYSHTKNKFNSEYEKAYDVWIGHIIPSLLGESPDNIKNELNESKFLGYMSSFYTLVKLDNKNDQEFVAFKNYIDDLKCTSGQCPNFHALYNGDDIEKSSRIDKFTICMNLTSRQLTKEEVQEAIDLIIKNDTV